MKTLHALSLIYTTLQTFANCEESSLLLLSSLSENRNTKSGSNTKDMNAKIETMLVLKNITCCSKNDDYKILLSQHPSFLRTLVCNACSSTHFDVGSGGSRFDNSIIEDDCVFIDLKK